MSSAPAAYREAPVARQLGALAASLGRLSSCARRPARVAAVAALLEECMAFIEWTAPQLAPELGGELADWQVMLALWRGAWPEARTSPHQRALLSLQAKLWSDRALERSGLLPEDAAPDSSPASGPGLSHRAPRP